MTNINARPIMDSGEYVELYCELSEYFFEKLIRAEYNDTPYVVDTRDSSHECVLKDEYQDMWCDTVDKVDEIISLYIKRDDGLDIYDRERSEWWVK